MTTTQITTTVKHPLCTNQGTHYSHTFPFQTAEGTVTVICEGANHTRRSLTLSATDLAYLEDSLQRDAVGMLRAGSKTDSPEYRANREMFSKIWDALYA